MPWWATVAAISATFLTANALFAIAFLLLGGVTHAAPASFGDAFFFSVQTMGTIGYGAMFPDSTAANVLVVAESLTSLLLTALATGLVFAKFSRSTARFVFTRQAVIAPHGRRADVDVQARQPARERDRRRADPHGDGADRADRGGGTFYRMLDLTLTRSRALSLSRSWNVRHPIDGASPLAGETPESMAAKEIELQVMVVGLDDTSMQTVHAGHRYFTKDILWGARHADVLSETPDGHLLLDLGRFHDVEPTAPVPGFPYP